MTTRRNFVASLLDTIDQVALSKWEIDAFVESEGGCVHSMDAWWDTNYPRRYAVFHNGQKVAQMEENHAGEVFAYEITPQQWAAERASKREMNRAREARYLAAKREVVRRLETGLPVGYTPGQEGGTLWAPEAEANVAALRTLSALVGEARANDLIDAAYQTGEIVLEEFQRAPRVRPGTLDWELAMG